MSPPAISPSLPRALRRGAALALGALVAAASPTARAATASIGVYDDYFRPADVSVAQGDTVMWTWNGDGHNVKVSGPESFTTAFHDNGATEQRVFRKPGSYSFICEAHPKSMRGTIAVSAAPPGPPPPASPPPPPPTPTRDSSAPTLTGRVVSYPRLRFRLSEPSRVVIRVRRGRRLVRTISRSLAAGVHDVALGRRLARGVYGVSVLARDASGNRSRVLRRRFTIR